MNRRPIALLATLLLLLAVCAAQAAEQRIRTVTSFDPDWRFLKSDAPGAEAPAFSDADWQKVDVPHDWAIEGPFDQNAPARGAGAFLPGGIGWYRKNFTLPEADQTRRIFIDFDGVMANSDVWINGFKLGHRPYGYVSFRYELSGHLNFGEGKTNVLAVRADDSQQPASRWYPGAGIYRHVRLVVTDPVHIDNWGSYITTPKVAADNATVHAQVTVINQANALRAVSIQTTIVGPDGQPVKTEETPAQTVAPGKTVDFQQDIALANPKLWNVDQPNLYRAITAVRSGGNTIDDDATTFGIRSAVFAHEGFSLNGVKMQLLGVCLHADGGAVGAAVPVGVWEHRLTELKKIGVNAIRCAHNPPAPEFLDLCDRMGFLVMDEMFDCWTVQKNSFDYHLYFREWNLIDTRDTVMRDRNHPSIVLYSAGNEIHDTPKAEIAIPILKDLVETFHKYDPSRAVTQALFRPNVSHDFDNGLADLLDVIGTNYRDNELLEAWAAKPNRKIIGTEQQHSRQTWLYLRDNPQEAGQFLWSGIDYLGEAFWPNVSSSSGLLDRTGAIKPMGLERQSWWSPAPVVKIVRMETPVFTGRGGFGGRGGRGGRGPASGPAADAAPGAANAEGAAVAPQENPPGAPVGEGQANMNANDVNANAANANPANANPANANAAAGRAGRGRGGRGAGAAGGGGGFGGAGPRAVANWTPRPPAPGAPATTTPATANINVYTNCDTVELFLNDKSLGSKPIDKGAAPLTWNIPFEPGTIKAVGTKDGKIVANDQLRTAGAPAKIVVTAERDRLAPTFDDVSFVTAQVVDAEGTPCPNFDQDISFNVAGPGVIAAIDNGNPVWHESFHAHSHAAMGGRLVAIIKASAASGPIQVTATSGSLPAASLTIQTTAPSSGQ